MKTTTTPYQLPRIIRLLYLLLALPYGASCLIAGFAGLYKVAMSLKTINPVKIVTNSFGANPDPMFGTPLFWYAFLICFLMMLMLVLLGKVK